MSRDSSREILFSLFTIAAIFTLNGCSDNSAEDAVNALSSPNTFAVTGTGTSNLAGTNYVFATSAGTIDTSTNTIVASFQDGYLPLSLYSSSALSDSLYSGSCSSLATLVANVAGGAGNLVEAQLSATGCSDQAVININLDTTQVYDNQGFNGDNLDVAQVTVDLAPLVTAAATGNTAADGSGTTEGSAGYFSISGDNSIVVTFSKNLTGGNLSATLSGCAATLGTPTIAAGSNGKTAVWPLTGFSGFSAGATCILNVATVEDLAGNADDPTDTNLSMTINFH
jgi:hypothetical protein